MSRSQLFQSCRCHNYFYVFFWEVIPTPTHANMQASLPRRTYAHAHLTFGASVHAGWSARGLVSNRKEAKSMGLSLSLSPSYPSLPSANALQRWEDKPLWFHESHRWTASSSHDDEGGGDARLWYSITDFHETKIRRDASARSEGKNRIKFPTFFWLDRDFLARERNVSDQLWFALSGKAIKKRSCKRYTRTNMEASSPW